MRADDEHLRRQAEERDKYYKDATIDRRAAGTHEEQDVVDVSSGQLDDRVKFHVTEEQRPRDSGLSVVELILSLVITSGAPDRTDDGDHDVPAQ